MKNSLPYLVLLVCLIAVGASAQAATNPSASCSIATSGTYSEKFTNTTYLNPNLTNAPGWGSGSVALNIRAGAFPGARPTGTYSFGERALTSVGGDFNHDGVDDIVFVTDSNAMCQVEFVVVSGGTVTTSNGSLYNCTSSAGAVITSGDFDGDGWLDLFYASVTTPTNAGTIAQAILLRNNASNSLGVPTFTSYDVTALLQGAGIAWHAGGSEVAMVDWNGDGRADLEVLSSSGTNNSIVLFTSQTGSVPFSSAKVIVPNVGLQTPIASTSTSPNGGYNCLPGGTSFVSRGGTLLAAGDINGDGYTDLVAASASENNILTWTQNQDGSTSQGATIAFPAGGPLLGYLRDLNGDGILDLAILQSGNDCNGPGADVWLYFGNGVGSFSSQNSPMGGVGYNATFMALFNGDNDANGTIDIIAGLLSSSGRFSYYQNTAASGVYNVQNTAVSKSVTPTLNPLTQGIVSVALSSISTSNTGTGATVAISVSNDGGRDWEPLNATEMTGAEHQFTHFGTDLRWKALLTGPASTLSGANAPYSVGYSTTTPTTLSGLSLTYYTVATAVYSRSNLAYGKFISSGTNVLELLFAASFSFPTYQAKLTAYSLSTLPAAGAPASTVQQVGGLLGSQWESGSLLAGTGYAARKIYTMNPNGYAGNNNNLVMGAPTALNIQTELNSPSTTPTMQQLMNLSDAEKAQAAQFLFGGYAQAGAWKFYDTGHSSPVFVPPPNGDANYLLNGYATFAAGSPQNSRKSIVLIGANDGMLHAFDATTGNETWAYVPNNLLPKLRTQMVSNANGTLSYQHSPFVDGSINVQDVYYLGSWRTVVVVGEAQGQGRNGDNFYFALDITDTSTPKPLWEFSDRWAFPAQTCDTTQNCGQICTQTCTTAKNANCTSNCQLNNSLFNIVGSSIGRIEAEHVDSYFSAGTLPTYSWATQPNMTSANPNLASNGSYVQNTSSLATGVTCSTFPCAELSYRFTIDTANTYYAWFRIYPTVLTGALANNTLTWGFDDAKIETLTQSSGANQWDWLPAAHGKALSPGTHTLNVWQNEFGLRIDTLVVQTNNTVAPSSLGAESICGQTCDQTCTTSCASSCASGNQQWVECGVGANLQCCPGGIGNLGFCSNANVACPTPETVTGETWSTPQVGRIQGGTSGQWTAFFASGYNNHGAGSLNTGRSVYALDAYAGTPLGQWNFNDMAVVSNTNPNVIDNTIPGGLSLVDADNDGYLDRVYFGDLDGRLWKINTYSSNPNGYTTCVLFDAGDPNQVGVRYLAPVITKPAVALLVNQQPNVYFGTGGDDRAPATSLYQFYSVRDTDGLSSCTSTPHLQKNLTLTNLEWVVGDGLTNNTPPSPLVNPNDEGTAGDRYWSDPVIVNNTVVYFSSLNGSIEAINPCISELGGNSKIFGYAIQDFHDAAGADHPPGQSVFSTPYLNAIGKIRAPALLRGVPGGSTAHSASTPTAGTASDVFLQSSNSTTGAPTIQRITSPGVSTTSRLRLLRWREISL